MNRPQTIREQADRLLALVRHAARFWGVGLAVLLCGGAVAMAVAMTRPRVYRSEALILYQERIASSALGREDAGESARRIGLRLRELVLSRSHLEEVINQFRLYPQLVDEKGIAEAVEVLRGKVGFKAREGDTYALSFEGDNADLVKRVTEKLTNDLVEENKRSAVQVAAGTKEFLDAEAQRIEEELKKRESRLAKFLSEHPAFAAEAAKAVGGNISGVAVTDPKKAGISPPPRRRSSDPRIDALEREADRIRARLLPPSIPQAPALSPEAKEAADEWNRRKAEATRQVEAAQRDLADKRQNYTDEHPDVKQAKSRVEAALRHLEEVQLTAIREMAHIQGRTPPVVVQPLTPEERQQLQTDLLKVQQDLARYKATRRATDGGAADEREKERESSVASEADNIVKLETTWVQLSREVAEAQDQRREVEAKRFTADIRDRMQNERGSNMQIIDHANKPTRPVRGGRTQAALIGFGATLLLTLSLMLLLALLDDRVYDRHDIERLGIGPLLSLAPPPDKKLEKRIRRTLLEQKRAQQISPGGQGPKALEGKDRKVVHG